MAVIRTIREIYSWKKEDFDGIRDRMRAAVDESPASGRMREILRGCAGETGKMIRPLLILMAAEDYSPSQRDKLLWSAAAGELLHTASLILDDIIDGADMRRGKPSVQSEHGKPAALCAGTHLIATAYSSLSSRGYEDVARELMTVTQMVCDGEMIQDVNKWNTGISEETYVRSIEGKTASVFSFACATSSRISGHSEETQAVMREFGKTAGILFQIRDDILDWTASVRKLGKPAGEDFANGIYTLPAIHTFCDPDYGAELSRIAMKRENADGDDISRARELVRMAGGIEYSRTIAEGYTDTARGLLGKLPQGRYVSALETVIGALVP